MANDRIDPSLLEGNALPKPEVEIIIDGQSVRKPGMKTYFVEVDGAGNAKKEVHTGVTAIETICTCDTVPVRECDCESVTVCTCDSEWSCETDLICTCDSECSCDPHCSCESVGGGSYCSCNPYCTCVPVH